MSDRLLDTLTRLLTRPTSLRRAAFAGRPSPSTHQVAMTVPTAAPASRFTALSPVSLATQLHGTSGSVWHDSSRERVTNCHGRPVHLHRDVNHCGRCGAECDPGETCLAGVCRPGPNRYMRR